jgi:hypothetical protein
MLARTPTLRVDFAWMSRRSAASRQDILPLSKGGKVAAGLPTGEAFRPEWIDFERGIRVGNLEPHERITQILKYRLEQLYGTGFVTDRWGRGVYWQWICWLPRVNRQAKPLSSAYNFGCAKLFIGQDRQQRVFQFGLQVERGYLAASEYAGNTLQKDWDWHRLVRGLRAGSPLAAELGRLIRREGFVAELGDFQRNVVFDAKSYSGPAALAAAARRQPRNHWAGFQLYYPMPERELRSSSGYEVVGAVVAAFQEVVPTMNLCMQVPLVARERLPRLGR